MDWTLTFRESQPVTVELCEQALSTFVGGPVSTHRPSFRGNPRDGFFRELTITAPCPSRDLTLVLSLGQEAWTEGDNPAATTSLGSLRLDAPAASFATKLAAWHALREAFHPLGWTDATLSSFPAPIVDEAEAAGEREHAARLRAEITAALVARARNAEHFEARLHSCRADDLEAVLEAYVAPERIVFATLAHCGLRALPRALLRFPNLEILHLDSNAIDGSALRVSFPKLYMLTLSRCAIQTLGRDDLAGFPALAHLDASSCPLRELEPTILEACPKLARVDIRDTPLANDVAQLAELRARWANVVF